MIAFDCLFLVFCHLTLLEASEALWCYRWLSLAYPCFRWRALALSCFLLLRFSACYLAFSFEWYPGTPSLTLPSVPGFSLPLGRVLGGVWGGFWVGLGAFLAALEVSQRCFSCFVVFWVCFCMSCRFWVKFWLFLPDFAELC